MGRAALVLPVLSLLFSLTGCFHFDPLQMGVGPIDIDLASVGDTGGGVVVGTPSLGFADQNVTGTIRLANATNATSITVYSFQVADPRTAGCTPGGSPTSYYLCPATTPSMTRIGTYTLSPGASVPFAFQGGGWLALRLSNTTTSPATVVFQDLVATPPR